MRVSASRHPTHSMSVCRGGIGPLGAWPTIYGGNLLCECGISWETCITQSIIRYSHVQGPAELPHRIKEIDRAAPHIGIKIRISPAKPNRIFADEPLQSRVVVSGAVEVE